MSDQLRRGPDSGHEDLEELGEPEQLVLSDLVNRVLDKGVVLSSQITISVADVDLIQLDLRVLISSVATLEERGDVSVRTGAGG